MRLFSLTLAVLILSGCASMTPPSTEKLAALPILEIGQSAPENHEYILHIAAGKPVPFKLEVAGDALMHPGTAETVVASRREIYLYKQWASFDGKTWQPTHQLFSSTFSTGLDTTGGLASIHFDHAP